MAHLRVVPVMINDIGEEEVLLDSNVLLYNNLGNISDIFHSNNQNHWLERRVWPSRSVP